MRNAHQSHVDIRRWSFDLVSRPIAREKHVYVHATSCHSFRKLDRGGVIDRVIKHLAILLAESLVAEGKDERPTIFIMRFNLTAIASTGD